MCTFLFYSVRLFIYLFRDSNSECQIKQSALIIILIIVTAIIIITITTKVCPYWCTVLYIAYKNEIKSSCLANIFFPSPSDAISSTTWVFTPSSLFQYLLPRTCSGLNSFLRYACSSWNQAGRSVYTGLASLCLATPLEMSGNEERHILHRSPYGHMAFLNS
jgi:hypothetical protein